MSCPGLRQSPVCHKCRRTVVCCRLNLKPGTVRGPYWLPAPAPQTPEQVQLLPPESQLHPSGLHAAVHLIRLHCQMCCLWSFRLRLQSAWGGTLPHQSAGLSVLRCAITSVRLLRHIAEGAAACNCGDDGSPQTPYNRGNQGHRPVPGDGAACVPLGD